MLGYTELNVNTTKITPHQRHISPIRPLMITSLTLLLNKVLNTGIFPDKLKIAKVTQIFKKGEPSLFGNYRPISLLPSISKVIEEIIFTQLFSNVKDSKLHFDNIYLIISMDLDPITQLNIMLHLN